MLKIHFYSKLLDNDTSVFLQLSYQGVEILFDLRIGSIIWDLREKYICYILSSA